MKNYFLIFVILFLIIVTTITKNSSKKLENQIFSVKENISVLKNKHELVLLDFNFLTSPKKLLEYQSKYFENDLVSLDINKIKEKTNLFKLINRKPITPSIQEIKENLSSRSAKLRFVVKKKNILNFKTDILDKFNYLIEIENYSEKL